MDDKMNEFWLLNIPEQAIMEFSLKFFGDYGWSQLTIERETGDTVLEIVYEEDGYPEHRYLNAYGCPFYPDYLGITVKEWFKVVRDANKGKTLNGMTYTEAFKKSHEKELEDHPTFELN